MNSKAQMTERMAREVWVLVAYLDYLVTELQKTTTVYGIFRKPPSIHPLSQTTIPPVIHLPLPLQQVPPSIIPPMELHLPPLPQQPESFHPQQVVHLTKEYQ